MDENQENDHQDPAEAKEVDTAVETAPQPVPTQSVTPSQPEVENGPGNPEPSDGNVDGSDNA